MINLDKMDINISNLVFLQKSTNFILNKVPTPSIRLVGIFDTQINSVLMKLEVLTN